ncbi:MAG TPA: hypothetical protein DHW02_20260 [Ktedonobacter sp.]|nr:hypothetical protein [Ktedonobacter sp.]
MSRFTRKGSFILLIAVCVLALTLMSMGMKGANATAAVQTPTTTPIGLHGYDISIFAKGTKAYYNPDDIEVVGKYVFVVYQNGSLPDGSNHLPSTIVAYTLSGKYVHSISINGHSDGLRYDPYTKQLWATSNEDANPLLTAIDLSTWATTQFSFPRTLHGGGYDDLVFQNGMAFFSASNPTLNSVGINTGPALVKVVISNGKLVVTPVLYGNATATDIVTGQKVTLNLTDPDSMTINTNGDIVLDSQGDAEHIIIHNAGTSQQIVSRLSLGTQVDDSLWIPSAHGRMLLVDAKQNTIYTVIVDGGFTPGTVYSSAPSDSGVAGFVGITNPRTGTITPVIIGVSSPKGLRFIPASDK